MTANPPAINPMGRYSATETATMLGISQRTLQRWVASGRIRPRLCLTTKRMRYRGRDILALWKAEF